MKPITYSDYTMIYRTLLLVTILLFPLLTQAKSANKEVVIKLWNTTNIDILLDNLKASIFSGKQNLLSGLADENAKKVKAIVDKDFATIKPHMQGFMIQRGSSSRLKHALKWIETPLGQKISKLNIIPQSLFSDPESPIPVKSPELSRERQIYKKKFEILLFRPMTSITEQTLEHFLTLENHTLAPTKRLQQKELVQKIKIAKVKVGGIVQQIVPHTFDRNFSDLSLEELTVTMNFLESESGRAYLELLVDAYKYAITQTQPKALLSLSKLYESELSILSPYSTKKISSVRERELMALLIKQHGKATIIRAMVEVKNGEMTIIKNGEEQQVFGRPNQKYVTLDTLLKDLDMSSKDIRQFYLVVQKKLRH